jgi:hypothetical protein
VSSDRGDAQAARHYAERARVIRQAAGDSATGVGESAVRLGR